MELALVPVHITHSSPVALCSHYVTLKTWDFADVFISVHIVAFRHVNELQHTASEDLSYNIQIYSFFKLRDMVTLGLHSPLTSLGQN